MVVYTAITGGFRDRLRQPLVRPDPRGRPVRYVCYGDAGRGVAGAWELLPPAWEHDSARRTARYHKLMSHALFPDEEYALWHDGSQQLARNPWDLVDRYLADGYDFASHRHPDRDCVYQELEACLRLRKDDPAVMRDQVGRYRAAGYPARHGLCETACVLRRHTPGVARLNEAWWAELNRGSVRDQLGVNYCLWRSGLPFRYLAGCRDKGPYFHSYPHR